jgi:hypothetical protein
MHSILMQFMFRWNTERRRNVGLEINWGTFDLPLVISGFRTAALVLGEDGAARLFGASPIPRRLVSREQFGLIHAHVTLNLQTMAADQFLPFPASQIDDIIAGLSADLSLFTKAITEAVQRMGSASDGTPVTSSSTDPGAAVEQAAVAVLEHASRITSAQWVSQHGGESTAAAFRLSQVETRLLRTMLKKDTTLVMLCNENKWELAAARWNSFMPIFNNHPYILPEHRTARLLTEDTIRSAVKAARKASIREAEQQHVHLSTVEPLEPYNKVSARTIAFNEYEDELIYELVPKYPKSGGGIRWRQLSEAWRIRWTAAAKLAKPEHHPRSTKQLHNRYSYLQRTAPARATLRSHELAEVPSSVIITPTSSIETVSALFAISPADAAGAADDVPAAVSSDTAITGKKRKYDKMTVEAAAAFTRLYKENKEKDWSFDTFRTLWDAEKYGAMDRERWRTRNQTEVRRDAAEKTRKRVKSSV